jgi:hypothetical protein
MEEGQCAQHQGDKKKEKTAVDDLALRVYNFQILGKESTSLLVFFPFRLNTVALRTDAPRAILVCPLLGINT